MILLAKSIVRFKKKKIVFKWVPCKITKFLGGAGKKNRYHNKGKWGGMGRKITPSTLYTPPQLLELFSSQSNNLWTLRLLEHLYGAVSWFHHVGEPASCQQQIQTILAAHRAVSHSYNIFALKWSPTWGCSHLAHFSIKIKKTDTLLNLFHNVLYRSVVSVPWVTS